MQPDTAEPGRMQRFVAALLRHEGALVEPISSPRAWRSLRRRPCSVRWALASCPAWVSARRCRRVPSVSAWKATGSTASPDCLVRAAAGRAASCPLTRKTPSDPERALGHELVLDNATFRLLGVTPAWTRYLVMDFRAAAVSDDKRDFVSRLGVNLATGALPDAVLAALGSALDRPSFDGREADPVLSPEAEAALPAMWERARVAEIVERALPPRLEAALSPFVKGMRRRLGRDQDRLYQYHNDLHHEAMCRALGLPAGDAKRTREEQRAVAIEREYRAKLDDLARQYATRVTVEWMQTQELVMPVHRFAVQIRRRKANRIIALDWNPLARRLEPPMCDATAGLERPRLVCDDALHLVAPAGIGAVFELRPRLLQGLPSDRVPEMRGGCRGPGIAGHDTRVNREAVRKRGDLRCFVKPDDAPIAPRWYGPC